MKAQEDFLHISLEGQHVKGEEGVRCMRWNP